MKNAMRRRVNLVLPQETREHGRALASRERRSFNNLVEVLIEAEWQRRFGTCRSEPPPQQEQAGVGSQETLCRPQRADGNHIPTR